ncbi:hypothetical protein KSP40_PGU000059 [Platanthera guangdongensis]|uniref:Uncharacterized protein n=1 Tax=Platanthera guangdongensis TaxID=2320717 RepID=A0ABR2LW43_9ASPA
MFVPFEERKDTKESISLLVVESLFDRSIDLGGIATYEIEHNFVNKYPICFSRRDGKYAQIA